MLWSALLSSASHLEFLRLSNGARPLRAKMLNVRLLLIIAMSSEGLGWTVPSSRREFLKFASVPLLQPMVLPVFALDSTGAPAPYDSFSSDYDGLDGGPLAKFSGLENLRRTTISRATGRTLEVIFFHHTAF